MKYVVNKTNVAYRFGGKLTLGRRGVLVIDDEQEKELLANFMFQGLKARDAVSVTRDAPSGYEDKGAQIAAKDAEIRALKDKLAKAERKLDLAEGTGKETATVIDSSEPLPEQPKAKAKSKKKEEEKPADEASAEAPAEE